MSDTALVLAPRQQVLPSPSEWQTMAAMATELIKSGLLPAHIKSPQAALAVILKGKELGIPAMYSLSNIVVINGKPTANAELMLALIYRDHGDDAVRIMDTTPERCVIEYKRRSWKVGASFAFTLEDARKAGLIKAGPWTNFPAAMLRARCISAVARMGFPDTIGGMYTAEELGAAVDVQDGEEIIVQDITPRQEATSRQGDNGRTTTASESPAGALRESTDTAERRKLYKLLAADPEAAKLMDAALAAKNTTLDAQDMDYVRAALKRLQERIVDSPLGDEADQPGEPAEEPETAPAPALDPGRRAHLNGYIDAVTVPQEALKAAGKMKPNVEDVNTWRSLYGQGQMLTKINSPAVASVSQADLVTWVGQFQRAAMDELKETSAI